MHMKMYVYMYICKCVNVYAYKNVYVYGYVMWNRTSNVHTHVYSFLKYIPISISNSERIHINSLLAKTKKIKHIYIYTFLNER